MFDNPEIKKMRQDIDAISEMLEQLIQVQEERHADVMGKLELIEQAIVAIAETDDTEEIREGLEDIKTEIEEVKMAVEGVEGTLDNE